MHLILDQYGVQVEVSNEMFKISLEKETRLISAKKLSSINIMKPVNITSPVLLLAATNQVPLLVYDAFGKVQAMVWSAHYQNIANVRMGLMRMASGTLGIEWMKKIISMKIENQQANIRYFRNRKIAHTKICTDCIGVLQKCIEQIHGIRTFSKLRAAEAWASKNYWKTFGEIFAGEFAFKGREKKGTTNFFNSSLNYAYGVLYAMVESSLLMVGLDPYTGIMHANQYGRPALAYDHIEPFRPWIDRMIAELWTSGTIGENDFEWLQDKTTIKFDARRKILTTLFSYLAERADLNGKRIKRQDHIHFLSSLLVQTIREGRVR
ncbi:MAG: CRISPR-associated endonuclease Cas1 [Bacteroidetes bacterium]|nr:CRISPR-associated endonuclease Cas1 [Bacteroidota bacterium]